MLRLINTDGKVLVVRREVICFCGHRLTTLVPFGLCLIGQGFLNNKPPLSELLKVNASKRDTVVGLWILQ